MIKTVTKQSSGQNTEQSKSSLQRMLSGNSGKSGAIPLNGGFSRSRPGSARASFRRPRGNIQRSRPKSHHRRVMSDTNSIRDQIISDRMKQADEGTRVANSMLILMNLSECTELCICLIFFILYRNAFRNSFNYHSSPDNEIRCQ